MDPIVVESSNRKLDFEGFFDAGWRWKMRAVSLPMQEP